MSYHARLEADWERFYRQHAKGKTRRNDRRKRRRLEEVATVEFLIARAPEDIAQLTDQMIDEKIRRYQETGVPDLFAEVGCRDFYHRMAKECSGSGLVHVSALKAGNEVIAIHWGLAWGSRYYWLMPTFACGEWQKYSPGRQLLQELLQWGFSQGLQHIRLYRWGRTL